jgi:hypothetical protein
MTEEWPPPPVVWRACFCYIWPMGLGTRGGRCGKCGEPADFPVEEPASGKAEPLSWAMRQAVAVGRMSRHQNETYPTMAPKELA